MVSENLYPVIMAGGASSRLWPRSRQAVPKWALRFDSDRSLLQMAWDRAIAVAPASNVMAVTGPEQAELLRNSLPDMAPENCLVEPMMRDTAGCIALATGVVLSRSQSGVMLVLPGDHLIAPVSSFAECVRTGERVAVETSRLVTIGIVPRGPATCYGYIHRSGPLPGFESGPKAFEVEAFKEKPDEATAREYVQTGAYYWNAGIFVWTAESVQEEFRRQLPEHAEAVKEFAAAGPLGLDAAAITNYPKLRRTSIDYGIMEGARQVAVVEAGFDWDDIGSWSAAKAHMKPDGAGNALEGAVLALDAKNCLILGNPRKQVVVIGARDLAVIDTPDALLICPLSRDQDVKRAVEELRGQGRGAYL